MTTPVGLNISGWTRQTSTPILDGNNPTNVRSGSGSGHGLAIDYYAAPFAQVSGATSDDDVQNAAAFVAATTSGSPCTFACAAANATAGDITQVAAGVITFVDTGSPHIASILPASGTSLNPIVFVAENPAAYNSTSTLFTRLERVGDISTDPSPLLGTNTEDYITYDGFYANYAQNGHPGQRGLVYANGSTNIIARRFRFDRTDLGVADDSDNFNCIQLNTTTDSTAENNIFNNGYDNDGGHNKAAITTYQSTGLVIQHNELINVTAGLYLKGDHSFTVGNTGVIRFNKFVDCKHPLLTFVGAPTGTGECEIYQNLVYHTTAYTSGNDFSFEMQPYSVANSYNYNVHHNTFIVNPDCALGGFHLHSDFAGLAWTSCDFNDNIVACLEAGLSAPLVAAGNCSDLSPWTSINYNWYYNNGSNLRFQFDGLNYNTASALADWRTNAGVDANASSGNPGFTDAANYDFTITSGGARTASSIGGPVGCYIDNTEEIGLEASPSY